MPIPNFAAYLLHVRVYALLLPCALLLACASDAPTPADAPTPNRVHSPREAPVSTLPDTSDLGLPTALTREAGKAYPVDEAPRDPSFVAFRQDLLAAVERRDGEAIAAAVADTIHYSFGADDALKPGFLSHWRFDGQGGPPRQFWEALGDVLRGGGVWRDRPDGSAGFYAPYTASAGEVTDPYVEVIITGRGVNVRAEPTVTAPILTQLSYDIVPVPQGHLVDGDSLTIDGRAYDWTAVRLPGGAIGYVVDKYVASPIDYRASFSRRGGTWRMTSFIAGD